MREIRTSGSVGASAGNRRGYPTPQRSTRGGLGICGPELRAWDGLELVATALATAR